MRRRATYSKPNQVPDRSAHGFPFQRSNHFHADARTYGIPAHDIADAGAHCEQATNQTDCVTDCVTSHSNSNHTDCAADCAADCVTDCVPSNSNSNHTDCIADCAADCVASNACSELHRRQRMRCVDIRFVLQRCRAQRCAKDLPNHVRRL